MGGHEDELYQHLPKPQPVFDWEKYPMLLSVYRAERVELQVVRYHN